MIGLSTIRQGDRVAVWNQSGSVRIVDGPKRLWLFGKTIQTLHRFSAAANQYLVIQYRDGSAKHVAGPADVWLDPVAHELVTVAPMIHIKPHDAMIIYQNQVDGKGDGGEGCDSQVSRRVLRGPARFMPEPDERYETVEPKARYNAGANEYLILHGCDGQDRHIKGPADAWFDPIENESIEVKNLTPVDANEALVVYARDDAGEVGRRVLRGPAQYMPAPNEWLHVFSWHGSDSKNPRRKVPHALTFNKLRVIPDQTYFDVRDVRSADDALMTVQVMIFFELVNIELMLDQTHDPVADFINAVTADVIDFAASRAFDAFKRDTEQLNELTAYPNLIGRARRIGYQINKVVYRGYEANPKLQAMHDDAIEARTALQLEAETEKQAQELADLRLERDASRADQQRNMQRQQTEHDQRLKQLAHEQTLREKADEHQQVIRFDQERNEVELELIRAQNAERGSVLSSMKGLQVDLTRYLVAQYQNPDRLVRIEGGSKNGAQLHLHEPEGDMR